MSKRYYVHRIDSTYYNFSTNRWQRDFTPECLTSDYEQAYKAKGLEQAGIYSV